MFNKNLSATYNNVIDALKCVAISHGMVNNVSSGNEQEIDIDANSVYPLVHIVPGNVTAGVHSLTFNFNVLAMDLVKDTPANDDKNPLKNTDGNGQQVLSDTMQILIDIIAQYKQGLMLGVQQNEGVYGQADDKDFSIEPFTERFDNIVSGWNCSFSIEVPGTYFACNSFNWEAGGKGGEWEWTDNGAKECGSYKVNTKEDNPDVMSTPEEIIPIAPA
jgi:hypothetical protein